MRYAHRTQVNYHWARRNRKFCRGAVTHHATAFPRRSLGLWFEETCSVFLRRENAYHTSFWHNMKRMQDIIEHSKSGRRETAV